MAAMIDDSDRPALEPLAPRSPRPAVEYIMVEKLRAADDRDTCLRPLGLCELGGACDSCWYRPDHPRFRD